MSFPTDFNILQIIVNNIYNKFNILILTSKLFSYDLYYTLNLNNSNYIDYRFLQKCINLQVLFLEDSSIANLINIPLNICELYLNKCDHICNFDYLYNFNNLEILDLSYTLVKELSFLQNLDNLTNLYLVACLHIELYIPKNLKILDISSCRCDINTDLLQNLEYINYSNHYDYTKGDGTEYYKLFNFFKIHYDLDYKYNPYISNAFNKSAHYATCFIKT